MKIYIVTEGGRKTGFGHVTRCISLFEGLSEKKQKPEFIINGDSTLKPLLGGKKCHFFNWLKDTKKFFGLIGNADLVITDSILADKSLRRSISQKVKLPVFIDDYKRLDYKKGAIVDWTILAEKLNKSHCPIKLLGIKYAALRKEFWDLPVKSVRKKISRIMVFFGGSDVRNMTPRILKLLNEKYPRIHKDVIIGNAFENASTIKEYAQENVKFIYSPGAAEVRDIMLNADVAVAAGGQTLYELARVGVPTIAILVVDNQADDVNGWAKVGFIDYAGHWDEKGICRKVLARLSGLAEHKVRLGRSKLGRRYVDGKGCRRLADKLFKYTLAGMQG